MLYAIWKRTSSGRNGSGGVSNGGGDSSPDGYWVFDNIGWTYILRGNKLTVEIYKIEYGNKDYR